MKSHDPNPLRTTAINRIVTLTGEVPDAARHRNYLESLMPFELEARLKTMEAEAGRQSSCATYNRWHAAKRTAQPALQLL